ncbi:uncharacterized protein NPIL_378711 [Nephila pilipes]|uniref:Uncharacterized protein n=1 Tax=Nephila pilipes TaxID=299642 RepID=A0A8X6QUN2_NEPPI|nr:uncharacterized protein NPIL_378711 [Nephila pilipes]
MMKILIFALCISVACAFICRPLNCDESKCQDPNCKDDERPKKVGCACCATCVKVLKKGDHCVIRPMPLVAGGPPRVPTAAIMCDDGLYCNPQSHTCQ